MTEIKATKAEPAAHVDLKTLEYPRLLHKPGGAGVLEKGDPLPARRVEDEAEARAAIGEGWVVDPNEALHATRAAAEKAAAAKPEAKPDAK
jgi:hypothetical protein